MRIFFATDLHGSTVCFKKFLAAKEFYQCDYLVLGGDLTGKAIVPIQNRGKRASYKLFGKNFDIDAVTGLTAAQDHIRNVGLYPLVLSEQERFEPSAAEMSGKFEGLIAQQMLSWDSMAAEKRTAVYLIPGNDDILEMDAMLSRCSALINCDRQTLPLSEGWTISGLGGSNKTPWDTPREYSEQELAEALESLMSSVPDRERCVFNIHVPPYGSGLDMAEEVDDSLRVVTKLGQTEMLPVGSTAVHDFIKKWSVPLALHGHVHDARGWKRIGNTLCINPGSEYFVGVLDGCIVELGSEKVTQFQLTRG